MIITKSLDNIADDTRVLKNPHKGWYWHYFDNGMKNPKYRDKTPEGEYYKDFPGLNHLYLRVDWSDIQPDGPDKFDWSEMDRVMDKWGAHGYRFSIRVCCSETSADMCFAAPKWLYKMGCKGMFYPPTREECPEWYEYGQDIGVIINPDDPETVFHKVWEPDYGDEMFLYYLEEFLKQYAKKYDNDPRVEYIDLGSYGNWGEGHVYYTSKKSADIEVLKKHAYLHRKYFKNKHILLNDDVINSLNHCTEQQRSDLYDVCRSLDMGIRDDSILAGDYKDRRYHSLRGAYMFDDMYKNAPVDLELGHYGSYEEKYARGGLVIIESARRAHATYAGFHGYVHPWIDDNYYVTQYLANRLGYWYIINSISHNDVMWPGVKSVIILEIENMGFAQSYHKYTLEAKLTSLENGSEYVFASDSFDNRLIEADSKAQAKICASLPENAQAGKYTVSVRMRENDTVIKLALKEEYEDRDGFYLLSEVLVKQT